MSVHGRDNVNESACPLRYFVVPADLAGRLHEPLRRHFKDDPTIEVVVERRTSDRRGRGDRRSADASAAGHDRRRIRNLTGRRIAERRAALVELGLPPLPRRAQRYADRLVLIEGFRPSSERLEDIGTARLVTRFQAGETDVFSEIYMRYFDRVYGYLNVAFANPHDAEDATQDVFAKLLQHLPRYERRSQPFRSWMFTIVRNQAVDRLRERHRIDLVEPEEIGRRSERAVDAEYEGIDVLGWISDRELLLFVERLPLAQRQVLVLRYMLGLSGREIARVLDRSHEDVRILQHRALRFLRDRLVAVGREPPMGPKIRMRRYVKQARVLRTRRFALRARVS